MIRASGKGARRRTLELGDNIQVQGVGPTQLVKTAKYCDAMQQVRGLKQKEKLNRNRQGQKPFGALTRLWRSRVLKTATKVLLYKINLVRSVMLFALELRVPTSGQEKRLESLQARHLPFIMNSPALIQRINNEENPPTLGVRFQLRPL